MYLYYSYIVEVVKQKGLDSITVEDLVLEMVPKGRGSYSPNFEFLQFCTLKFYLLALVPDTVKKELLNRIRTFLAQQSDL